VIVLTEDSPRLAPTASTRDLHAATEAAKLAGCRVYHVPQDFSVCETAENALWHVPEQPALTPGVWVGYIPAPARYREVYAAALRRNIRLLNTPEEHLRAQEFDRAQVLLRELTPESVVLTDPAECAGAVTRLGLPVFVKGAIQSRKASGWSACVAVSLAELEQLVTELIRLEMRSRGRVVVRRLVPLRHSRVGPQGFPFGREYRVFVYRERVLAWGYYWEGDDPLRQLGEAEEAMVLGLAVEAARRLDVPYVAVDVGQAEDGCWIVIETGDGQFSGASQTPLLKLWHELSRIELIATA
jgi:hypothetical protein